MQSTIELGLAIARLEEEGSRGVLTSVNDSGVIHGLSFIEELFVGRDMITVCQGMDS